MNINHLHDFLCVAETLNVTQASDIRNTTQSNLSKRLKGLEDFLGKTLIDRRRRPLCLTKAGKDFVPQARQLLADIEGMRQSTAVCDQREGSVSVVMPHNATIAIFPQFKKWLSHEMADVHLVPVIADQDNAAHLIANSEVDLAFCTRHPSVPIDKNFSEFRRANIGIDRLVVIEPIGASACELLPLHVSHPLTYIGRIWQSCRPDLAISKEVRHGMSADIRAQCLAERGRGVLPESVIEADVAAGRFSVRECNRDLEYAVSLFCAPQATRRAKQIWELAANRSLGQKC